MNDVASDDSPVVLVLSLSNISMDARVMRQVRLFSKSHTVVTCGFGPEPLPGVEHIELHPDKSRMRSYATDAFIRLRMYRAAYWVSSVARSAKRQLRGRSVQAVLANDLNTAMLALAVFPGDQIHFDLHEFFPGTDDNVPTWVRHRLPYLEWQLRSFVSQGASVTTVSSPIAELYADRYGISAGSVVNAAPYQDVRARAVGSPVRFVYSGIAQRPRRVEDVMRAVAQASGGQTLDLFLTGEGTAYYAQLLSYAEELGPRIRICKPVAQSRLLETLRDYDIGIPLLPLEPTNLALALPNKLFDYIQARLGVVTGPNPSMADIVSRYGIGVVGSDNEVETFTSIIDTMSPETIAEWKDNAAQAAVELSAEQQNIGWERAIATIIASRRG